MPRCPLCTTDPKAPVWHRSMSQCPKRKAAGLGRAEPPRGTANVSGPATGPPDSNAKPIDEAKATAPVSTGEKPSLGKRLVGFATRESKKIADDIAKPKQEFDWILPEEANARLWQSGLSFLRQTLNLFNRFMGMPPIPEELMHFNKADIDSINEAFRAPTSKFLYSMGFKTVDSAVRFTLVFSGFSLFGLMVVQLGLFYAENLPKAERFKKWREKQQTKAKTFRERLAQERAAKVDAANRPALAAPAAT